jgi:chromosome segregation ATPase
MVTKEQVFAAADELQSAGQKPTLEAIRQRLGGSYTTLAPLLREWKAAQAVANAPSTSEPVPESVVSRMEEAAREVWKAALDLAASRLQAERAALETERTALESERDEAVALADGLAADLDAARAEAKRRTGEVAALQAEMEKQREAERERAQADAVVIAELRGRLAALEPLVDELRKKVAASA